MIRAATPADAAALKALARAVIRADYRPFLGNGVDAWAERHSDPYIDAHLPLMSVAESGGAIAGLVVFSGDLLDLLMVDGSRRGEGLGAALLRHAEEELFRGHATIRLESFEANTNANGFYLKRGWVEARRFQEPGKPWRKIAFEKLRRTV